MDLLEVFMFLSAGICILLASFVMYTFHTEGHWKRRKIYTVNTGIKFFGQFADMILKRKAGSYVVQDIYNDLKSSNNKIGGIYRFGEAQLVTIDLELIKDVTIKHFDHFTDRRPIIEEKVDKLFGRSILNMKGEEWRDVRHQLSPAFTASKLRGMMDLIDSTCHQLTKSLAKRTNIDEPIDMNEKIRRFTADVISTTAFGSVSDALNEPDAPFYKNGINMMDMTGLRALVVGGYFLSPKLMSILNIPFLPSHVTKFFVDNIISTIKYRETHNKSRPDMIQLLLDARKEHKQQGMKNTEITDIDIVSQAFTFFLGGFDTIATALSFSTHLLAMHPEVQERLREEVDEAFTSGGGKISYEAISEMKYMDMVVSEVLRMFPPGIFADRVCTKPFQIKKYGIDMDVGDVICIPIYGFHFDPDYFPEPERFDPERFSEANKHNIKPSSYLPFGSGPRNCIGMRFALIEMKLCLAHILATNKLEVSSRTQLPIKMTAASFALKPEGGFWLNVKPRENPSINP